MKSRQYGPYIFVDLLLPFGTPVKTKQTKSVKLLLDKTVSFQLWNVRKQAT